MAIQHITQLRCVVCGTAYPADNRYTCTKCGIWGILDVEYDYDKVGKTLTRHALSHRPWAHWRYEELISGDFLLKLPPLENWWPPVYHADRLTRLVGGQGLVLNELRRQPSA